MWEWHDFEPDESDRVPDKHILFITEHGEEACVIVHRTCGGEFPIDGELANDKRKLAQRIVDAMNKDVSVPYYVGDGSGPIDLEVAYVSDFPRAPDGTCAFCRGDSLAERSAPGSPIVEYYESQRFAETCPMCDGRPT